MPNLSAPCTPLGRDAGLADALGGLLFGMKTSIDLSGLKITQHDKDVLLKLVNGKSCDVPSWLVDRLIITGVVMGFRRGLMLGLCIALLVVIAALLSS